VLNRAIAKKSNTPLGPLNSPRDKFCAKRYLTKNENGKYVLSGSGDIPTPNMGFRSFGTGARICPGRHLSMTEISLVISKILRTFEVSLKDGQEEMKYIQKSILAFEEDLEVVLKPRVPEAGD
jgi:cytochrome P450